MRLLALLAVLVSTSAFACPNLSGNYFSCVTNGETEAAEITVTQKVENRATVYTIESRNMTSGEMVTETYRADGKTVTVRESDPDSGMTAELATTVSCNGTRSVDIKMKLSLDSEEMALITSTISKVGNGIKTVTRSVSMGEESVQTTICE